MRMHYNKISSAYSAAFCIYFLSRNATCWRLSSGSHSTKYLVGCVVRVRLPGGGPGPPVAASCITSLPNVQVIRGA